MSLDESDESLKVDPDEAKVAIVLPAPYRNIEWPMAGGYSSNAMYHLAAPGRLREAWSQDAGKGTDKDSILVSAPVIGGGLIYALDSEAHIYVFRTRDGEPVWNRRLAPKNGTDMPTLWGLLGTPNTVQPPSGAGGGIAYDAGRVYITSGFGVVICLDAKTGRDIWRKDLAMPIIIAPIVSGWTSLCLHPQQPFLCPGRGGWPPALDHQGIEDAAAIMASSNAAVSGETVIAPYTSGEVFALRAQNGQIGWSDVLSRSGHVTALSQLDDIAGRPVIDRGVVFAISQSGLMAAFSLNTGDRMWARDIAGIQDALDGGRTMSMCWIPAHG